MYESDSINENPFQSSSIFGKTNTRIPPNYSNEIPFKQYTNWLVSMMRQLKNKNDSDDAIFRLLLANIYHNYNEYFTGVDPNTITIIPTKKSDLINVYNSIYTYVTDVNKTPSKKNDYYNILKRDLSNVFNNRSFLMM